MRTVHTPDTGLPARVQAMPTVLPMIDPTLPVWHELRFNCPTCKARRGQACQRPGGTATNYHAARIQLANAVWRQYNPEDGPDLDG